MKRLPWIESLLFFFSWTLIMLSGADFPPPSGFIWLILIIAVLSILQWFYLGWLLKTILQRKTFLLNLLLFCCTGFVTALLLVILNGSFTAEIWIWFLIIMTAAAGYGSLFWLINRLLLKHVLKEKASDCGI